MKTIVIISAVTFALIFGGVALLALQAGHGSAAAADAAAATGGADQEASARVLRDLQAERDRIQREKEELAAMRQSYAVQEQVLAETYTKMQELAGGLSAGEQARTAEQTAATAKLAKMYEAMPPAKAAPILAALASDVTLDIMRHMKERQAAAILAAMDAGIAAQISTQLSLKGD
jgi:flagellar motility protein MotE (MotC chaperone)